jgi:hypothetical protein
MSVLSFWLRFAKLGWDTGLGNGQCEYSQTHRNYSHHPLLHCRMSPSCGFRPWFTDRRSPLPTIVITTIVMVSWRCRCVIILMQYFHCSTPAPSVATDH